MLFFSSLLFLLACAHRGQAELPPPAAAQEQSVQDPVLVLQQAAVSDKVTVRLAALSALIELSPEPAGGVYGAIGLADSNPYVQRAAVDALAARLPEAASLEHLRAFCYRSDVDPFVRGHAGVHLALTGEKLPAHFTQAMDKEPAHWKRIPLALPAAMMGDAHALETLQADLRRGDLPMELTLFQDIGGSGLTVLTTALLEGLPMMEEDLIIPVAAALLELGDSQGESLIKDALGDDELVRRLEAVDALAKVHTPQANTLLNRSGGPPAVKDYANLVLVERGAGDIQRAIASLSDADRELRTQAAWAMGGFLAGQESGRTRRQAHAALLGALQDLEPVVVSQAVSSLGQAGDRADLQAISPFLDAESETLQVRTAHALLSLDPSPLQPRVGAVESVQP
ncbi:MAG: HEAT repeat protein [Cognaticolwellia sp.]|jgi:HEAT repeat protein